MVNVKLASKYCERDNSHRAVGDRRHYSAVRYFIALLHESAVTPIRGISMDYLCHG